MTDEIEITFDEDDSKVVDEKEALSYIKQLSVDPELVDIWNNKDGLVEKYKEKIQQLNSTSLVINDEELSEDDYFRIQLEFLKELEKDRIPNQESSISDHKEYDKQSSFNRFHDEIQCSKVLES